jgi:hypothetical protein
MVTSLMEPMQCGDERRNAALLDASHPLNGVDYVEYRRDTGVVPGDPHEHRLEVTFLKPPDPTLVASSFQLVGGVRIVGVQVTEIEPATGNPLRLFLYVDRRGDFSTYYLHVDHPSIDDHRSDAAVDFRAGCPTEFDCRPRVDCPPEDLQQPALDYLAKDYQSFRRMMLDLIPGRNPNWTERNPADVGIALVELFAYAGDYLSYFQDAVGTEAYLDSCQHRISAARHARLIDYRMHQGRNAATFVHFEAGEGGSGIVPQGTRLCTRISDPLRGESAPPDVIIPSALAEFDSDPALADAVVFETMARTRVVPEHNELRIHDWGDFDCCIARGARQVWLFGVKPAATAGDLEAYRPTFAVGNYLLLEEALGPRTGAAADRSPAHRQVVQIVAVEDTVDETFLPALVGGQLTPRALAADPMLPLQHVTWRAEDALRFPLCLSATNEVTGPIGPVSIARGNIAAADHGRTVRRRSDQPSASSEPLLVLEKGTRRLPLPRLYLPDSPLTHQPMPPVPVYADDGRVVGGRRDLDTSPRHVMPAVVLQLKFDGIPQPEIWEPQLELLNSTYADTHFVAEVDDGGVAELRFGDDQYGRRPTDVEWITAIYRIGNGSAGNLGAGALAHLVAPSAADLDDPDPSIGLETFAEVDRIYQPLPAEFGTDPETIDEVRELAPEAMLAETYRAVTEADYEQAALKQRGVAAAKASFRWTGSWYTVFVAIHPLDEADLDRLSGGGVELKAPVADRLRRAISRYKLAGYDLVVRAAAYVPLEIEIQLCIARGHFRGDVLEAVSHRLSSRRWPDATKGFFFPPNFTFGQPVYVSQIYAAIAEVEGVDSALITVFKRYWEVARGELDEGVLAVGPFEIPSLLNDRNAPERGVLRLTAVGGL